MNAHPALDRHAVAAGLARARVLRAQAFRTHVGALLTALTALRSITPRAPRLPQLPLPREQRAAA